MKIYEPEEDSYFLSEVLKEIIQKLLKGKPNLLALDMGSGSGILAKTLINMGVNPKNLTLVDINKEAIKQLKKKFPSSKVIRSNLFSEVKGKFDLIVFNPPYLPEHKFDKELDTSGGKMGSEIINNFLSQASTHLTKDGKIILLASNLTKGINFKRYIKKLLKKKKLFFEELFIYEIWLKN